MLSGSFTRMIPCKAAPALTELVSQASWHRVQEHLGRVLSIPIRTIGRFHELLVPPSWPASLTSDSVMMLLRAGEELEQLLPLSQPALEMVSITTAVGATYAAIPIHAAPEIIVGYVVLGPVVVGVREEDSEFRQRITRLGFDATALWPVLLSLKLFSFNNLRAIMALIEEVGNLLAAEGYQSKLAQESACAGYSGFANFGEAVARTLLEAAIAATDADGGSVMAADPLDGYLRIRAAEGLSKPVLSSTRLAVGEGLSGLVLTTGETLLLDDKTSDVHVKNRMRRREIVSSLIIPIHAQGAPNPVGVLNLRSTTAGKRFTARQRIVAERIVELAFAAQPAVGAREPRAG